MMQFHAFGDRFNVLVTKVRRKNGSGPIVSIGLKKLVGADSYTVIRSRKHKKYEFWREMDHFIEEYKMGMWTPLDTIMPIDTKLGSMLYLTDND